MRSDYEEAKNDLRPNARS